MKENIFSQDTNLDVQLKDDLGKFYWQLFPTLFEIDTIEKGSELDLRGIDKILKTDNESITIQEKVRRRNAFGIAYDDFLIEFWHSDFQHLENPQEKDSKKGWIFKTEAEQLFYIMPNFIYQLNVEVLVSWVYMNQEYLNSLKWLEAYNKEGGYYTYNKAVPWDKFDFVEKHEFIDFSI